MDDAVDDGTPNGARPANWGNMFAVMVGDFLLSKAHALSSRAGAGVSQAIAETLARACEGQVRERRNARYLEQSPAEHLVGRIVEESGAADRARTIARDHAERAKGSLVTLANHPVRPVLSRLAEYAVSREAALPGRTI